jgi:hypothetical protein
VFFFDRTVDECIGKDSEKKPLEEAQKEDKGAINPKTDGVSVVACTIG